MALKLKALEKNILKYRALQMILILHEMESLREFVIGSIRSNDKIIGSIRGTPKELPEGTRKPFKKALQILVEKQILSEEESIDIQEINEIRNSIGHAIHNLVDDISHVDHQFISSKPYDYDALGRLECYRERIEKGIRESYVMLLSLRGVAFEQAELTYKEELARLKIKIDRQYKERRNKNA